MGNNKANGIKSAQLGMSFGAACHRLRKLVLFNLLSRHGENICYRCSEAIADPASLSIEHKRPWQDVDIQLFWDLENIAFSHLSCNAAAGRKVNQFEIGRDAWNKKVGPAGMLWCSRHQQFLPESAFTKNGHNANGFESYCQECRSEYRSPKSMASSAVEYAKQS